MYLLHLYISLTYKTYGYKFILYKIHLHVYIKIIFKMYLDKFVPKL